MADRPVDDILADLLALEEEAFGSATATAQTWDPDAVLADPDAAASKAAADAADAALLADCDALLADVDLLLSDPVGSAQQTAAGAPRAARSRPAQAAAPAARAAATAAVLSECDALLADADLLLADEPEDHFSALPAAAAAAAAPAAAAVSAAVTPSAAVSSAVKSGTVLDAVPKAQAPAAAAAAGEGTGAPVGTAVGVVDATADSPAHAAAGVGGSVQAAAGASLPQHQQPDVDLLLLDLLTADDKAVPEPPAHVAGVPVPADEPPASPGSTAAALASAASAAADKQQLQQAELSHQHHQQLEQQQQQLAPQHHHHEYQQADIQPLSPASPQQKQQQEPVAHGAAAGNSSSSSSADSSEDFLGEMLHDMAEVLEVDEGALGVQPFQAAAAAAAAAALGAVQPAPDGVGALPAHNSGLQAAASSGIQQRQHGLSSSAGLSGAYSSMSGSHAVSWQQPLSIAGAAAGGGLPPHELALQQAWAQEEALVHGDLTDSPPSSPIAAAAADQQGLAHEMDPQQQQRTKRRRLAPLPRLQALLSDALADWNPAGRPDASGTAMIGGSVLLCLESLAGLFAVGAAAAGAAQGVDWAKVLSAALAPHGQLQVLSASGQYLAVGAASGSALVFQLPVPQAAGSQGSGSGPQNPTHSLGSGHSPLPGGAAMWQLGGHSGGERGALGMDPVSSLGFSVVGAAAGDALWLAVGHVSGSVTVWELQKRGPRQVAGIAQHSSRLTFTTFMPGRGTSLLLSGDVRGRCCLHTFSASLLRTNVASRVLIAGEYGPLLSIAHLAPFALKPSGLPAGAIRAGGAAGGVEWPDAAAWSMLCEEGAWRVGEGVCCLTTPTHTYIARVKPSSGDLVMLFSIPQPHPGAQQQAVPVAAWLPHSRQKLGGHSRLSGDSLMPVGVLALGWGSRLVLFEVPLVGDQITAGEAAAVAVTASQAAAAAQQAKRTQQPAAVAAAAASRLWQQRSHTALDSLSPDVAISVATQFPLSTCASWTGGQQTQGTAGQGEGQEGLGTAALQDLQQHQLHMGPAEPLPILGVHWLDADALAVVCNQGYSSLLLVLGLSSSSSSDGSGSGQQQQQHAGFSLPATLRVYEQVEWMDQPVDRSWGNAGVGAGGLTAWGTDCGGSVVGSGARMYLLGQQGGLFCGRLMPWSERLKTLQDVRKYKLGMYFALRFYLAMKQEQGPDTAAGRQPTRSKPSSSGGLAPRQSVGGFARSEGIGAQPQQLEQWMLSLVLGHASATLSDVAASAPAAAAREGSANGSSVVAVTASLPRAVTEAAEACVCACLLLSRTDVLFGRVFQLFAQQGVVPGALGALVETVELAVLSDLLQGLAPEVMQALVEHFAGKGQPGRVEACVVHLPIMSLDLNQVICLCEGSGLYSALTHVYNQMNDFRKPLLDLLANVAAAPSWQAAEAAGYKLLVYLRCCFRGMAFPPGTGSLPTEPAGVRDVIQATLLGSLLFLDRADLLREWQQSGGTAAAMAAAVLSGHGQAGAGPLLPALCDPHPALQLLLAVDVPATITVLAEATAGWDAVETDLRAAAGKPTTELESVLVATQVVVNALVTLLEAGRFQQWQAHRPAAASNSSSSGGSAPTAQPGADVAMSYIIQLLAAGRVNAKPSFVIKLLQHLVAQASAAAGAAAVKGPAEAADAAAATAVFEQQFIAIVQVVGVQSAAGAVRQQQGPPLPGDATALSPGQAKEVLQLAKRCNFVRAAATVHHLQGNYAAALSCYLALVDQQQQSSSQQQQQQQQQQQGQLSGQGLTDGVTQTSRAVFDYINSFLGGGGSSPQARKAFLACVCQQVVPLIRLDPDATAALLLQHMPEQQVPVLLSLQANPELQFQFLRAAMQQNQLAGRQSGSGSAAAGPGTAAATAAAGPAGAGVEPLLERPEVAILYVKLLARFEPSAVLPFLQSHHSYNVAEAIQVCRKAGVHDAEAFLHERLGDLDAALRLYVSSSQQANSALQAAVLAGSVPLLLLPPGYWVPGWFDRRSTARTQPNTSSSSSRDQQCFGMEHLVQQLESVAQMVTAGQGTGSDQAAAAAAAAAAVAPGELKQASEQLLTAAANVAATLLHQLDPTNSSSSRKPDRAPAPPGSSSLSSLGGSSDEATSSAAAALQLPPPLIDLYKSWMAQLSPRLRLKGLGAGAGTTAKQATGAKHHAATSSSSGSSNTAGAVQQAGVSMPDLPEELQTAWQALQAAVAFCQRNTRPGGGGTAAAAAGSSSSAVGAGGGQELWFKLMDVYVGNLGGQKPAAAQQQQGTAAAQHDSSKQQACSPQQQQQQQVVADLRRAISQQVPLQDLPAVLCAAAAAVAVQQTLPGLLRLLFDEVVCSMADHLPLLDIVGRIIQQHGNERFGEFRSTLLGLFGATGYDSAIMSAANRLITGDAFAAVRHAYGLRQLARALQEQQQQNGEGVSGSAVAAAGSNRSMLAAPSAAAAAAAAPAAAVQSAVLLGVLGPGSYGSSSSSSGMISSNRYSLSQADRDLIQGILGTGGMRLQLQPAGPLTGQLPGITAAYKAAAQAVADTGRIFQGEMDLALELAMLQSLQEHQQHQRRQQHGGAGEGWGGGWQGQNSVDAGRQLQQDERGGMGVARATASTSSFDIDELLNWSATNM